MVARQLVRVLIELPTVALLDRDREPLVYLGALQRHDAVLDRFAHERMPEHQASFLIREQPCNDRRNEMLRDLFFR